MSEPIPIKSWVVPGVDGEREMLDYCQGQIAKHVEMYGEAPSACAIVLESDKGWTVHSWSARSDSDRTKNCGAAAALLLKRATDE